MRLRRDLTVVEQATDLACNLGVLTAHRADLIADRVRLVNRLLVARAHAIRSAASAR